MKHYNVPTDPTRPAVLAKIAELEREGKFDTHADPVDMSIALPVTTEFPYIPKKLSQRLAYFLRRHFVVYPFTRRVNREMFQTEVKGRENLADIDGAILTCNHVNKFDCMVVQQACRPNRPFVVAAHFNNMKGSFGEAMRAGGMLPLGETPAVMRRFLRAVQTLLARGKRVLIYPEQAMWWYYEKPRPYKEGAFSIAVKNGVPVVPMFITFRPSGRFDENGIEHKFMTLHIMPPLYARPELGYRENVEYLRTENMRLCREKYREVYGSYPEQGA